MQRLARTPTSLVGRSHPRLALAMVVAAGLLVAGYSHAGSIGDKTIPLLGFVKAQHLYSVTGIRDDTQLATLFHCTSTEPEGGDSIVVGVEVFDDLGSLQNDVSLGAGIVTIPAGHTRTIATRPTAAFAENEDLGGIFVGQGSARILASSKNVLCTAMTVDPAGDPPASMVALPVFSKLKLKGD